MTLPTPSAVDAPLALPSPAALSPRDAWRGLRAAASAPYRAAGLFAWYFARCKLQIDPVFRHLLGEGLIRPNATVLDLGCGQGLLASLLAASERAAAAGAWPDGWAAPPHGVRWTGIELMARDVGRARAALGAGVEFVCGDMREVPFPACDTVVLLDALHYVGFSEQDRMLARIRAALGADGVLLLRICDAGAGTRFGLTQRVDRVVTRVRGHRVAPTFCRSLPAWQAELRALGFEVEARPMSRGTPFSNVLLVARVATAPSPR